jgi:LacI family transcriptional regulator
VDLAPVLAAPSVELPRPVSLQDVADRAGVSLATASRVMGTGPRRVGAQMVERVTAAAAELGYSTNLAARAVATGRSSTMGVLVHDIADPYFSTIAASLIDTAEAQGVLVSLANAFADPAREQAYVALMRSQRARAVVLIGSRTDDAAGQEALRRELQAFRKGRGRAVCIGQALSGVDTVVPENAAGAQSLAVSLVAHGHRSFAVLAGPAVLLTARDRVDGFRAGLATQGVVLDPADVVHGAFTRDGGYEAMSSVLASSRDRPSCIFAVNDVMAVGALARLRAEGLAVPGDVAVAGFDDILTLRDVSPPLTTVRLPLSAMGELAGRLALGEAEADSPRVLPVRGEVIMRESTAVAAPSH